MIENKRLPKQMDALKAWCKSQPMHVLEAEAAATSIKVLQDAIVGLSEIRAAGIRAMAEDGWSHRDISKELRVSRARVDQIINR